MRRSTALVYLVLAIVVVFAAMIAGCASAPGEHPAVTVIRELLELRRDDNRDPQAYAEFFLEPDLAAALAEGSGEPTGTPRVPQWEQPYVSEETTDSASVVVIWKPDDDFEGWPAVNVFSLSLVDERWVVIDAVGATGAPEPLRDEGPK